MSQLGQTDGSGGASGRCCAPSVASAGWSPGTASGPGATKPADEPATRPAAGAAVDMVTLDGGTFAMGGNDPDGHPGDGEGPVRKVRLDPFDIGATTVTNEQFADFVSRTGHVTTAQRTGWSFVFAGLLPDDFPPTRAVAAAPWWRQVFGADWSRPDGPHSTWDDRGDHPVVHVSWFDAAAYCRWVGGRLPTEAEWEFAARGGHAQRRFPWGDELTPGGRHLANVWQGTFPAENTVDDGWYGTAPVRSYEANGFGLFDVVGNVWEWTADWFGTTHTMPAPTGIVENPTGPRSGTNRAMRGGSYLCHASYCNRYRLSARSSVSPESTTGHLGFRCAAGRGRSI